MQEQIRNPDVILKQIAHEEEKSVRGKLKIFFGYAAGVGKTYAMLEAAHIAKNNGVDVVAGYIEPHARPKTEAMTKGLERVPTRAVSNREITVQEFDIDAALKRNPELILVDELAHTNACGSRHQKRYQDIQELLKAGIHVYTTVNVQHIESLNDMVAGITHVIVRERIPDFIFDQADQVELVDIEPNELLERLKQGKIYKEQQAKRALDHFFTLDNLVSLREIALRRMADRVNLEQELRVRAGEPATAEHILICLSSSPSNEKVIRQAARMANAFRAKFTAFFVETPDFAELSKEDLARLRQNMRLAEQLGAKTITSYGSDIVEQIAEFSKVSRVSKLVLGRTYTKRSWFSIKESFSDRLTKLDPQLEIFLIPDTHEKGCRKNRDKKVKIKQQMKEQIDSLPKDIVRSALVLIAATAIAYIFRYWGFSDANLIMVYILGVLITSLLTQQKLCSIIASFVSVLVFNFCFTVPIRTFSVNDPSYIATFGIMFLTALIGATLTQKVKKYARQAARKAYRTEILLETSRKLQKASNSREIALSTARQLCKLLERSIIFYEGNPIMCKNPIIFMAHGTTKELEYGREELAVAEWVYKNNKHAGYSTTTLPGVKCLYLAVRSGDKVFAVVGVDMNEKEMEAFQEGLMSAILNECALALEKNEWMAKQSEAEVKLQREQLRANLLRSISHDLRTPLTCISGNAGILLGNGEKLSQEQKYRLYTDIYDDSMWLINLVENLLSVTRIENGTMQLNLQAELLDDVIQEALRHTNRKALEHHIVVREEDDLLMARMDVKLILQVILNLVDNAIKYTPAGSEIKIMTKSTKEDVLVEVRDNGAGLSSLEKERLFDMFYTANQSVADGRRGMGLGLALCKSIIQAHGGEISVRDNKPSGTVFCFNLRKEEVHMQ